MPRGLCTASMWRWLTDLDTFLISGWVNNQHNPWNHQHSTCTLPMPSMFVIQTQELFLGWEILLAWCSVCSIDNGLLRISCTFYKSLFLNRNVIKFKLRINLFVCCCFLFSVLGKCIWKDKPKDHVYRSQKWTSIDHRNHYHDNSALIRTQFESVVLFH